MESEELSLDAKIESLLFWKGEPVSVKELSRMLSVKEGEVQDSLKILEENLSLNKRGIVLVREGDNILLTTHSSVSNIISELQKEELTKDLSKAALETLSIILYRGPIKRSELDYIRGVNSQFILRTLSIRGLVERKTDPGDERTYVYSPSLDLLQLLGISSKENLPDYQSVNEDIEGFMKSSEEETENNPEEKEG